jgi:hypothetical protein
LDAETADDLKVVCLLLSKKPLDTAAPYRAAIVRMVQHPAGSEAKIKIAAPNVKPPHNNRQSRQGEPLLVGGTDDARAKSECKAGY